MMVAVTIAKSTLGTTAPLTEKATNRYVSKIKYSIYRSAETVICNMEKIVMMDSIPEMVMAVHHRASNNQASFVRIINVGFLLGAIDCLDRKNPIKYIIHN